MQISPANFNQYSPTNSNVSADKPLYEQEKTKQTQQQNNEQVSSVKPSNETSQNTKPKPLTDDKAVKEAEVELALSKEELLKVSELKQRDAEVKNHEAAHLAAAGKHATGGATYEYKRGPDGKSYAVSGEVGIDTSPIPNNPSATLRKAQQIQAAANAPANPSAQDRQVAAQATVMAAEARVEISQERTEKASPEEKSDAEKSATDVNKSDADNTTHTENEKAKKEYKDVAELTDETAENLLELVA